MQQAGIQAFVGHSFTDDDAAVVGKFTKYFDSLSGPIGLHWFHAEPAQPKELTEKVLTLMRKANVFIAICTRKERVCREEAVQSSWWSRTAYVRGTDLEWKTSDWVIQEVGAAKALGLKLILLIEKGVRGPGGLQGNVEYIEFSREAPEQAFGKITEMLGAISSSPRALSEPVPEEPPVASAEVLGQPNFVRAIPQCWRRPKTEPLMRVMPTQN